MTYYRLANLSDWQRQIIYGTIMGGSSVVRPKKGKNYYLSMRGKNAKWLQCKAMSIGLFMPPNPYYLENNRYFRWHTACSPDFKEFHDTFYVDGRKEVRAEVLDEFRAVALAVWFLDAGVFKKNQVYINIQSFLPSAEVICEYFRNLDLNVSMVGCRVVMDVESTKKFIGIIEDYIPEFILCD